MKPEYVLFLKGAIEFLCKNIFMFLKSTYCVGYNEYSSTMLASFVGHNSSRNT